MGYQIKCTETITADDKALLVYLANGWGTKQIAGMQNRTFFAVERQRYCIYRKLGVKNSVQAVAVALHSRWLMTSRIDGVIVIRQATPEVVPTSGGFIGYKSQMV